MTKNDLHNFALEVHRMPNGREKFRLEELIEMAKHGLPARLEEIAHIEAERDDYREQVAQLESKLGIRNSNER